MSVSTAAKQVLDESSFQQLLAAAFVVQQHNDSAWAKAPARVDTASVLSEIGQLESRVRAIKNFRAASQVITEKLLAIVGATGVSLSLISNGYLDCVAESGVPAKVPGSSLASHSLVATERLKAGEVFETADARGDMRLDTEMCQRMGVGCLVTVPVLKFGDLAGLLEIRWARPRAFDETGLLACRLTASVVTRILENDRAKNAARKAGLQLVPEVTQTAESVPEEKAAPATVKPDALPEAPAAEPKIAAESFNSGAGATATPSEEDIAKDTCRVCGQPFGADEAFCGHCSMPRVATTPTQELQSKWASMWFIQKAQGALAEQAQTPASQPQAKAPAEPLQSQAIEAAPVKLEPDTSNADSASAQLVRNGGANSLEPEGNTQAEARTVEKDHFSYFLPTPDERGAASEAEFWQAAAASSTRSFFRNLRVKDVLLLMVAVALMFGVISAWPSSSGRLTWFGSLVVRLGLARHSVPSYAGNPGVNVWVDGPTSRYYCPGEDLYGKTSSGRFSTQLEAEQLQMQPASGLVCQ